jgi:hypothetical protein
MRSSIAILLAVLALAVAAAGCGSSSDETSGTSPETQSNPPASTSTTPEKGQEAPVGVRAERCGEGATSGGEVRVTGVSCELGRSLVAGWYKDSACSKPNKKSSRTSCRLGKFVCQGTVTDRGQAIVCARQGQSIAFIGKSQ